MHAALFLPASSLCTALSKRMLQAHSVWGVAPQRCPTTILELQWHGKSDDGLKFATP